ncbi:hypothetical protein CcaverHIS002_0102850 [Cutaneotrichosporon cavernicola]|uniref:Brain protein I3 n=1 Tax=Cutaneotrichosporon cavernicola TaxID=279322 RepID=A0AA48L000_9TREE|nr:uncharacterized protein CcaverHIS019_0102780 [Cutaneotrichosporon cavernicola]BEI79756.1 hypothetical protein CcaverHIS002_0102850 [Cutaneotrichosporon cavernicola]BEI87560.1 hypothetical protein CcaverHIS019_0102780 [Cutaneotrichosporon cavernicola]BEI95331.1 hypothetical protein CcaverHIS631_0102800 [Cutaneotrichosporon cavernicola]BEJ03105.1 hypothetical protein CcaverHIS641_0102800 [Cutaneotrichosporon cavernicola]
MEGKENSITQNAVPSADNGTSHALNPECARYGHDTRIRARGLCFLIYCFPFSMIYFIARKQVTCGRCGMKVAPQGILD